MVHLVTHLLEAKDSDLSHDAKYLPNSFKLGERLEVHPVFISEIDKLHARPETFVPSGLGVSHFSAEMQGDDNALAFRLLWIGVQ